MKHSVDRKRLEELEARYLDIAYRVIGCSNALFSAAGSPAGHPDDWTSSAATIVAAEIIAEASQPVPAGEWRGS